MNKTNVNGQNSVATSAVVNVKTNKFEYTLTFNDNTMSMSSTDKNPNLNFENTPIPSVEEAISRFKFLMKMRNEVIIEWNDPAENVGELPNVNVVVRDNRANGGNFKWQINAVKRIKAWFDIYDLDMSGVNLDIIVNASEIIVKAEHNGVKYFIDTPIKAKTSMSKIDSIVGDSFRSLVMAISMEVLKQENEQENEDIDYLVTIFNEKMEEDISKDFESTLQTIAEYGDTSGENEYVCGGFNYERDYEHEWVEFYNENGNGGINHAYEIFRNAPCFTFVDFFNEDSACELVYELGDIYGVGVDDNCCEDCLVWVKNPYYNAPKNDTPCLDIDIAVDRVANTIEKYLGSYTPSYLDQFGDCVITVYWDSFTEQDMNMLIEDSIFALSVRDTLYERGVIENLNGFLVYDDGVYVTVDYDKMFKKVA